MLIEKFGQMKITCVKLMSCNLILFIGILMISDAWDNQYEISEAAYLLIMTGLGSIIIIVALFVKRLCVPLKILICPLAISLTPALLVIIVPNEFALFGTVVGMLVLFMLWADKQFMALPKELCVIDKSLQIAYPRIQDKGPGRISDKQFLVDTNDALGQISQKEFTEGLLDAISKWYAVYIGFCFLLEGIAFGLVLKILI